MRNINALFFHGPSSLMMFTSLILIATWPNHVSGAITTCLYFSPDDNDDFYDCSRPP